MVDNHNADNPTGAAGIEEGVEEETATRVRPYDATKIRITTKSWSLRQVIDDISDGTIDLFPDFQRSYVWKSYQQSRLVESILLGIPLPSFYFNADETNTMQVVDGVQRLTTIQRYYRGEFALSQLEYLTDLVGRSFPELDTAWRRRFQQTQILVHVIEPQTPPELKFDIFRRLNTLGTPLTAQQIRHCLSRARSRDLLARMASGPAFVRATRGAYLFDPGMTARELALRFIALRDFDRDAYTGFETLDDFLIAVTRRLDDPKAASDRELDAVVEAFETAMSRAWDAFGTGAFRRSESSQINRALFDSWAVALAEVDDETFGRRRGEIARDAKRAMDTDAAYVRSFSEATGYAGRIEMRLEKAREIVRGSPQ